MKKAELIELGRKNYDLVDLLNGNKDEIVIGRRDRNFITQEADIFLGEKDNGELDTAAFILNSISRRQAIITYDLSEDRFYAQDCSTHGTTRIGSESLHKGEKRILENGAELFLGNHKYGPITLHREI